MLSRLGGVAETGVSWDGRTDGRTDGRKDGRTDGVTRFLDLLSPTKLATQVKIKHMVNSGQEGVKTKINKYPRKLWEGGIKNYFSNSSMNII